MFFKEHLTVASLRRERVASRGCVELVETEVTPCLDFRESIPVTHHSCLERGLGGHPLGGLLPPATLLRRRLLLLRLLLLQEERVLGAARLLPPPKGSRSHTCCHK